MILIVFCYAVDVEKVPRIRSGCCIHIVIRLAKVEVLGCPPLEEQTACVYVNFLEQRIPDPASARFPVNTVKIYLDVLVNGDDCSVSLGDGE